MNTTATINIRHKLGILGKLAVHTAAALNRLRISVPVALIATAVNHSSYLSIDGGKWTRFNPGLDAEGM